MNPFCQYGGVTLLKTGYDKLIDNVFINEKEVYLALGKSANEVMNHALVSCLGWEQVSLIKEEIVLYVAVNPNKKVFQLKLLETERTIIKYYHFHCL